MGRCWSSTEWNREENFRLRNKEHDSDSADDSDEDYDDENDPEDDDNLIRISTNIEQGPKLTLSEGSEWLREDSRKYY